MAKSWELYQQPESGAGIPYALRWIAGASNGWVHGFHSNVTLTASWLYAVPFDQLRAVTLDKMSINLDTRGPAGAKCRLGIYENASDKNNKPVNLVKDAGELDIGPNSALGNRELTNLNTNLGADKRYWAVLLGNANVGGANAAKVYGVKPESLLFWGAREVQNVGFVAVSGIAVTVQ